MIDRKTFDAATEQLISMYALDAYTVFRTLVAQPVASIATKELGEEATSKLIRDVPIWHELLRLYDYACLGVQTDDWPPTKDDFMDIFFDLDVLERIPEPVKTVVVLAEARCVLDGGTRELLGPKAIPEGCLEVSEVALLADMEFGSARNAMGQRSADRLVGELHGNRTFIAVNEARRWLAGRRGFVPTTRSKSAVPKQARATLDLPRRLVDQLVEAAASKGVTVERLLVERLKAIKGAS